MSMTHGTTDDSRAPLSIVWLQASGCGGCTMSLLGADLRQLFATLADGGLTFAYHPAVSEASGAEARALLGDLAAGRRPIDILCVEGALQRGPHGTGRYHVLSGTGRPMIDWVRDLAERAHYVLAIGSCTAFGGVQASGDTDACGLQYDGAAPGGLLGAAFASRSGLPVINVAGCPAHEGWIIETLLQIAAGEFTRDDLDDLARPRLFANALVHHGCPRNEFYEFKASAERPDQQGCLMENLGCLGTQAHADCNVRPWHGLGSCVRGGFACVACTEPGFADPGHPLLETPKVAGIPVGLPVDMPKAWFVALAALSKSATPRRVRENAHADRTIVSPAVKKPGTK